MAEVEASESNTIEIKSLYLPSKQGKIPFPIDCVDLAQRNIRLVFFKLSSELFGGNDPSQVTSISVSYGKNAFLKFSEGYLTDASSLNLLKSGFDIDSLSSNSLLANELMSTSVFCARTDSALTDIDNVSRKVIPGVSVPGITGNFHLYAGELSAESQIYQESSRRIRTAGLLFGAENRAGRIFHGWKDDGACGIFYDHILARLLICNSGSVSDHNIMITSFPNTKGLTLTSANNLGINNFAPAYPLDVTGTIRGTEIRNSGGVITSDPRLKTNITSLNGGELWELCQLLNPITFVYKPDFEVEIQEINKDEDGNDVINTSKSKWPLPQGIQYGYNALEVEELLPELVDEDLQGIKYLNSGALFPIFQAAATSKIQSLESEVESLKQLVQSLVARIEVLENV